jgi:prolyl oligopeptidase
VVAAAAACGHPAPAPRQTPPPAPDATALAPPDVAPPPVSTSPPVARTEDVVETLFGVEVADPYRWMEGSGNAELDAWLRAQGAFTATYLARIAGRDAIFDRVRELGLGTDASFGLRLAGGRTFYSHIGAGEQLPKLMVRDASGKDRVLVDPALLGGDGGHASVNDYEPSPDGSLLAYDLSLGGGEISTLHVLDVATGKDLPDAIERVWGEASAEWLPDGTGFFYSQLAAPRDGVDPMLDQTVHLHRLGEPVDQDVLVIAGADSAFPLARDEFVGVFVPAGTKWMVANAGGARNEVRYAIAKLSDLDRTGAGKTPWKTVATYEDGVEGLTIHGDRVYVQSFRDASNRRLLSVPVARPDLAKAKVELAEDAEVTLTGFAVAKDGLYVRQMVAGLAHLLRKPWKGKATAIALPFDGWLDDFASDPERPGVTFDLVGWTQPNAYYAYDPKTKQVEPTGIAAATNADFTSIVADEVDVTSADGTAVPLSIVHAKDLPLDGSHPALVYAYGGYGSSQTPSFNPVRLAWLERGGVFAVCHVRGGGEKGHQWQVDGTHEHKMNGVHDFEACGQYLVDHGFTTAARLFAQGGSMGGILIGRVITDRPDLFAAANIGVGMVNPLRILAAENGANQKAELGDPETEDGFRSILEMDPYQHVADGTPYPAVLFTVGLNDNRVAPWMTAKMAARLQAATSSARPVLIRIDADAGHGIGSTRDQAFAERADIYSFFLATAGDPDFHLAE